MATAADSKKLSMGKDEALKAFQGLTTELGLAVTPGGAGEYAENQPQPDASAINNYYYEEGPPVVSYYPPPWDYDYLYDWVPYPFWASGFFFPGFFVLTDFDFVFVGHHHHSHHQSLLRSQDPCVRQGGPGEALLGKFFTYDSIQLCGNQKRCLFNLQPQHGENNVFTRS